MKKIYKISTIYVVILLLAACNGLSVNRYNRGRSRNKSLGRSRNKNHRNSTFTSTNNNKVNTFCRHDHNKRQESYAPFSANKKIKISNADNNHRFKYKNIQNVTSSNYNKTDKFNLKKLLQVLKENNKIIVYGTLGTVLVIMCARTAFLIYNYWEYVLKAYSIMKYFDLGIVDQIYIIFSIVYVFAFG